jgi:hypothetical protein
LASLLVFILFPLQAGAFRRGGAGPIKRERKQGKKPMTRRGEWEKPFARTFFLLHHSPWAKKIKAPGGMVILLLGSAVPLWLLLFLVSLSCLFLSLHPPKRVHCFAQKKKF